MWGLGSWGICATQTDSVLSSQLPFVNNAVGRRIRISLGRRSFSSFPFHFPSLSRLTGTAGSPNCIAQKAILEEAEKLSFYVESRVRRSALFFYSLYVEDPNARNLPVQPYTAFPCFLAIHSASCSVVNRKFTSRGRIRRFGENRREIKRLIEELTDSDHSSPIQVDGHLFLR